MLTSLNSEEEKTPLIRIHEAEQIRRDEVPTTTKLLAWILFFVLGWAPWLVVNSIYQEAPILIAHSPESCSIISYISVILQFSNITAILFVWLQSLFPLRYSMSVLGTTLVAIVISFVFGTFWKSTILLGGHERSIGLYALTFMASSVGCVSMAIYFPFASSYPQFVTAALAAGMGSNQLLVSVIAFIQDPGEPAPRFNVEVFFYIVGAVVIMSFLSLLIILNSSSIAKLKTTRIIEISIQAPDEIVHTPSFIEVFQAAKVPILNQVYGSILNYSLLSLVPYALGHHSNSSDLLMWATLLSMGLGSIARMSTSVWQTYKLTLFSAAQTPLWLYLVIISFMGASAPTFHSYGGWIVVAVYTIYSIIYGYMSSICFQAVYVLVTEKYREKSSKYVGLAMQCGGVTGTIISFVLILTVMPKSSGC